LKLQKTIANPAKLSGRGLFGGKDATVVFRPASADTGVVFVRTDTSEPVRIKAVAPNVAERARRTTLKKGPVSIETVEHCLAAVNALEIDNITVEVNGPELPAPDCSSSEYFRTLSQAGLVEQQLARREFTITEPITITEGDASIYALAYPQYHLRPRLRRSHRNRQANL